MTEGPFRGAVVWFRYVKQACVCTGWEILQEGKKPILQKSRKVETVWDVENILGTLSVLIADK